MAVQFGSAARRVRSSAIRDLLEVAERPDVISLAGGLPAPELFPVAAIAEVAANILRSDGGRALQYSTTEGFEPLRQWVASRHEASADQVLITQGSQQALDLVVRTLLDPGMRVAVVDPAYLGAIQVFNLAGVELVGVPDDGSGIDVDAVSRARPDAVYVVPNFHNPTGATLRRRAELVALAERDGFVVIEDDPYADLRWAGQAAEVQPSPQVIRLGSFSKILSPGLRIGYLIAPLPLVRPLTIIKRVLDLNTGTLSQWIVHAVVSEPGFLDNHLAVLRACYAQRASALVLAVREILGVEIAEPQGGMFVWVRLGDDVDTGTLLPAAIAQGVAFVPGAAFAVDRVAPHCLRMSFATASPDQLREGVERLSRAINPSRSPPKYRPPYADSHANGVDHLVPR